MAQGQRSPASRRETHHPRQAQHRCKQTEGNGCAIRTSTPLPTCRFHTKNAQKPVDLLPKLFGPLRERYSTRPGGYTRVLRIEPKKEDQAPSAILELVDGPRDMRFGLTAQTVARDRALGRGPTDWTQKNIAKVTTFREGGMGALEEMVKKLEVWDREGVQGRRKRLLEKQPVYKGARGDAFYSKTSKGLGKRPTEESGL